MSTAFLVLFSLAAMVQVGYAFYFFVRIFKKATPYPTPSSALVSVVVCAKNESQNLQENLAHWLHQEGKGLRYEVVVVNDASTDNTSQVLENFQKQYGHLRVVTIPADALRTYPGKKHAWLEGINAARYNWLLFTDADCRPLSKNWVAAMTAPLAQGKTLVAGYGGYQQDKGWLNAWVRWETQHTFLQYATYSLSGVPYMAVGRNMAVAKPFIQEVVQHPAFTLLPSGDDDLLVQCLPSANDMAVVRQQDAHTLSQAPNTFNEWKRQKQRHVSTGKYYRWHTKALLAAYAFSHALFWVLLFALPWFLSRDQLVWFQWMAALRITFYLLIHTALNNDLKNGLSTYTLLGFDIFWALYHVLLSPYIFFKNKQTWK